MASEAKFEKPIQFPLNVLHLPRDVHSVNARHMKRPLEGVSVDSQNPSI
jgi:hypothetical protein